MPDILVRYIDDATAERIKALALERKWSINDVILHALRYGLGLSDEGLVTREQTLHDVAHLAGTWDASEAHAFQEAMSALDAAPDGLFAHLEDAPPPDKD